MFNAGDSEGRSLSLHSITTPTLAICWREREGMGWMEGIDRSEGLGGLNNRIDGRGWHEVPDSSRKLLGLENIMVRGYLTWLGF